MKCWMAFDHLFQVSLNFVQEPQDLEHFQKYVQHMYLYGGVTMLYFGCGCRVCFLNTP